MSRPQRPEHAVSLPFEVAFHHCDPLGVAWHGRYFEWLDQARAELFRRAGLDVPAIRELGFRLYVVEAKCRYMAPLQYGDAVRVTAWFSAGAPLIRVGYDLRRGERWCARAATVLATTDANGVLLPSTPPAIRERLPVG